MYLQIEFQILCSEVRLFLAVVASVPAKISGYFFVAGHAGRRQNPGYFFLLKSFRLFFWGRNGRIAG
jgi:hypothetical protein